MRRLGLALLLQGGLALQSGCSLIVDLAEGPVATDDGRGPDSLDASSGVDARTGPPPDGPVSGAQCPGTLVSGTCFISCATSDCEGDIICPADLPCKVNCIGDSACETVAIDCSAASRCEILCQGTDACDTGGILCGGASCSVVCVGDAACEEAPIECNADDCDVTCNGAAACAAGVCCQGEECHPSECKDMGSGNCQCWS